MNVARARWVGGLFAAVGATLLGLLALLVVVWDVRSNGPSLGALWLLLGLVGSGMLPAAFVGWLIAPAALDPQTSVLRVGTRYGILVVYAGALQFGIVAVATGLLSNDGTTLRTAALVAGLVVVFGPVLVGPFLLPVTIPAALVWVVMLRAVMKPRPSDATRSRMMRLALHLLAHADGLLGTWRVTIVVIVLACTWLSIRLF